MRGRQGKAVTSPESQVDSFVVVGGLLEGCWPHRHALAGSGSYSYVVVEAQAGVAGDQMQGQVKGLSRFGAGSVDARELFFRVGSRRVSRIAYSV